MVLEQKAPEPPRRSPDSRAGRAGSPIYNINMEAYAPYYKHVRDRVLLAWSIHRAARYTPPYPTRRETKVVVRFRVRADGRMEELELLDDGGVVLLAADVLSAVRNAAPFNTFPEFVKEDHLAISFHFFF